MGSDAPHLSITEPGVYTIPEDVYHADPVLGGSLSSSGARKLLPPSCPALFQHWRTHENQRTEEMDFGVAAHRQLLGVGADIEVVDADNWRGAAAQDQRRALHAAGRVPLLLRDYLKLRQMENSIREHPEASALFRPGTGQVEQSLFWMDAEFEVWRRARLDLIIPGDDNHPLIVVDYKTTASVDTASMAKSMATYGYDQQGAWYTDAVDAVGLAPPTGIVFLLVFQMRDAPYLVRVTQPDPETLQWGRVRNRKALQIYRDCARTGEWPSYPSGVVSLAHPRWAEYQLQTAWDSGDFDVSPNGVGLDLEVLL